MSETISYISGGSLGDFLLQLSVIKDKYINTGKRGILYIIAIREGVFFNNKTMQYDNNLSVVYEDIHEIISSQEYIDEFKIYNNEVYDIDLSSWRKNPDFFNHTLYKIFMDTFNVEWKTRKWLDIPFNDKWNNRIIINTTPRRFRDVNYTKLYETYGDNLIFIASDKSFYDFFVMKTNLNIEYYCIAINSCKLYIGGLSMPLCVAISLHKDAIMAYTLDPSVDSLDDGHYNDLDKHMSNLTFLTK